MLRDPVEPRVRPTTELPEHQRAALAVAVGQSEVLRLLPVWVEPRVWPLPSVVEFRRDDEEPPFRHVRLQ